MTSLPPGTIIVPMMPQSQATNTQSQVNNASVGSGTRNDDQTTVTSNVSGQESNQVRAANFLQLWNKRECDVKILQDDRRDWK
eukprot:11675988-Ditylum_brightwellii.AAC.1